MITVFGKTILKNSKSKYEQIQYSVLKKSFYTNISKTDEQKN